MRSDWWVYRIHPGWWLTRDRRYMSVGQMDTSHLNNTITMIERSRNYQNMQILPRMYLERSLRRLKNRARRRTVQR